MRKIMRKFRTTWDYARMGIKLGATLRSKWILASMLPRLKLQVALARGNTESYTAVLRIDKCRWNVHFRKEDIFIFHDVFTGNGYIGPVLYKDPPRCIVDLGAHIGLATLRFASSFPQAELHCYEPDPENFHLLRLNTASLHNVVLHSEAVGVMSKKSVLFVSQRRHSSSSLRARPSGEQICEVECVVRSLDDLISSVGENVDLIKFDIESGEQETFANSVLVHQVKHVVGEMKATNADIDKFVKIFHSHESQVQYLGGKMYLIHLYRSTCG